MAKQDKNLPTPEEIAAADPAVAQENETKVADDAEGTNAAINPEDENGSNELNKAAEASEAAKTAEAVSEGDGVAELAADEVESSASTTEVNAVLNELADELQTWMDRKETRSGSRCSLDALPEVIGILRAKANQYS